MDMTDVKESSRARQRRLLRQFSKIGRTSLGTCLMGTLFTFPSVLAKDLHTHSTSLYGTHLTIDGLQDLVGSLLMLASLPGAWLTAFLAMRLGRRKGMMLNGVVGVVGWLGIALVPHSTGILVSRCVSGLALGGMTVTINAYAAELSDDEVRGMMSMCLNFALLIGQVLTVALGYSCRYYTVAFINALIPAGFVVFLVWLPESPSFLAIKGKDDKAMEVLRDLRGQYANVKQEVSSYKEFNKDQEEEKGEGTWRSLLQPAVLKSLLVVSVLFTLVAFTGFVVVNANTTQILDAAGSSVDSGLGSIVLMVMQLVGGVVGFFLVDKIGRRNILFVGFSLMTLALFSMAAYCGTLESNRILDIITTTTNTTTTTTTYIADGVVESSPSELGWVPLACLVVSQTATSLGVNQIPFMLNQEYFPTAIRSQASGVCYTVWTLTSFTILQLYTPMVTALTQTGLYSAYAAICLFGIPFTAFFIRETAGQAVG